MKQYRNNGAIGALLDEYEKSVVELQSLIKDINENDLIRIVDHDTSDPDCKSIQTILSHVIESGYTYIVEIRKYLGETIDYIPNNLFPNSAAYIKELNLMLLYNIQLFDDYPSIKIEESDEKKKIHVRWGLYYDVEQLMEHAIVHILRHRRQIELFLIRIK